MLRGFPGFRLFSGDLPADGTLPAVPSERQVAPRGGRLPMQLQPDLELTAIVVCHDDEELVGHRIRRLSAHLRSLGLRAEILAVDESSGDNSLAILSILRHELPELRIVCGVTPGRGFQ